MLKINQVYINPSTIISIEEVYAVPGWFYSTPHKFVITTKAMIGSMFGSTTLWFYGSQSNITYEVLSTDKQAFETIQCYLNEWTKK